MQHAPSTPEAGLMLAELAWQRPADNPEHPAADQIDFPSSQQPAGSVIVKSRVPAAGESASPVPLPATSHFLGA
jgi:hypothetical protein